MKNLKKLVSVIVTVAMLVSSLAALSVSAAYPDVDANNSYAKARTVLSRPFCFVLLIYPFLFGNFAYSLAPTAIL